MGAGRGIAKHALGRQAVGHDRHNPRIDRCRRQVVEVNRCLYCHRCIHVLSISLCCTRAITPVIALLLTNRQGLQYPVRHLLAGAAPTSIHQISQADLTEKIVDLARQVLPQMMRQAGLPLMAVTLALTVGHIDRLIDRINNCLLYTSPSPRDGLLSRMPSSA